MLDALERSDELACRAVLPRIKWNSFSANNAIFTILLNLIFMYLRFTNHITCIEEMQSYEEYIFHPSLPSTIVIFYLNFIWNRHQTFCYQFLAEYN